MVASSSWFAVRDPCKPLNASDGQPARMRIAGNSPGQAQVARKGKKSTRRPCRLPALPGNFSQVPDRSVRTARNRKACMIYRKPFQRRPPGFSLPELVRSRRLELPRVLPHSDLNAARLPIPPRPHASAWNFRLLASDCGLVKRRMAKKDRPPNARRTKSVSRCNDRRHPRSCHARPEPGVGIDEPIG